MSAADDTTPDVMSKGEALALAKVVRAQARVGARLLDEVKAERLAQLEAELSAEFDPLDDRWQHVTEEAERLVATLDGEIAAICRDHGVRPEFRPGLRLWWHGRGENGDQKRRAELRKAGQARIEADIRCARTQLEAWSADAQTRLVARNLTSDDARSFLSSMPTPAELVPVPTVAALEAETGGAS